MSNNNKSEGVRISAVRGDQIVDENGVTLALLKLKITYEGDEPQGYSVSLLWNPELTINLPGEIRAEIVAHLRKHADKLESGEQARRLTRLTATEPGNA